MPPINIKDPSTVEELGKSKLCEDCDVAESTWLYICRKGICIMFAHICDDCLQEFKTFSDTTLIDEEQYMLKGF